MTLIPPEDPPKIDANEDVQANKKRLPLITNLVSNTLGRVNKLFNNIEVSGTKLLIDAHYQGVTVINNRIGDIATTSHSDEYYSGVPASCDDMIYIFRWLNSLKRGDEFIMSDAGKNALAKSGTDSASYPLRAAAFSDAIMLMDNLAPAFWRQKILELEENNWEIENYRDIQPVTGEGVVETTERLVRDFGDGIPDSDLTNAAVSMFTQNIRDIGDTQMMKRIFMLGENYGVRVDEEKRCLVFGATGDCMLTWKSLKTRSYGEPIPSAIETLENKIGEIERILSKPR